MAWDRISVVNGTSKMSEPLVCWCPCACGWTDVVEDQVPGYLRQNGLCPDCDEGNHEIPPDGVFPELLRQVESYQEQLLKARPDVKREASMTKNDDVGIVDALTAFFSAPINDYGTAYVSIPQDFTGEEQGEFLALVHEDRCVSREEQINKLRAIRARRTK